MKLLEGKTALITGAARGIGKALAIRFAQEGANIAFTDLVIDENGKATEEEIASYGVKAKGYASNAADFAQTKEVVFFYRIYQFLVMIPLLAVLTVLAASVTIIGSVLGASRSMGYWPGHLWAWP